MIKNITVALLLTIVSFLVLLNYSLAGTNKYQTKSIEAHKLAMTYANSAIHTLFDENKSLKESL
jgi:hypothetical protein|tara:strand:- start:1140 stop:1331 length:192 start_codon:yes stop_codon:yes gene_type:complete